MQWETLLSTKKLKKLKGFDVEQKRGKGLANYINDWEIRVRVSNCPLRGFVNNAI